mgnify:CR=1 FL=1
MTSRGGGRAEALTGLSKIKTGDAAKACTAALARSPTRTPCASPPSTRWVELKENRGTMGKIQKYMTPGTPRVVRNVAIAGYSKLASQLVKDSGSPQFLRRHCQQS